MRFLKYDVKAPRWLEAWLAGLNYRQVLPLAAVDPEEHRFLAWASLKRGMHSSAHAARKRFFPFFSPETIRIPF